jgi:hypothetical protein
LTSETMAFVVFCFDAIAHRPDYVLLECTLGFDRNVYGKIFTPHGYEIWAVSESQVDTGLPGARVRQLCAIIDARKWAATMQPNSLDFRMLFNRKCMLLGDAYFQAPDDEILAFANAHAEKHGLEMFTNVSQVDWTSFMTPKMVENLMLYELEARGALRYGSARVLVANLQQNCGTRGSMMEYMPTLLPSSSSPFLLRTVLRGWPSPPGTHRFLTPRERLAVMGWPVYTGRTHILEDVLGLLSDNEICRLAGNGFCIPKVGKYLFCFFACVEPLEVMSAKAASTSL